ncbi:hypothetical protein Hanom_Chr07g00624041 [Helianthus anomalus]
MLSILIVPFLCYFLQVVVVSKVAILTCYLDYEVWRGLGWGHCSTRGRCGFHQSTPKKWGVEGAWPGRRWGAMWHLI